MKNQKGISMIALIITIIVIIILAAIVFIASGDTMSSAQFSTFCQEFGDYAINFQNDPLADVQLKYGTTGKAITKAQAIWLAADPANTTLPANTIIPSGKVFTGLTVNNDSNGSLNLSSNDKSVYCYKIVDTQLEGYKANHKFYGDNLGTETHWVTNEGFVFTLPGYPRTVNGQNRMYINTEYYYDAGTNFTTLITEGDSVTVPATTVTPATGSGS